MDYQTYIKSMRWKKLRAAKLRVTKGQCEVCSHFDIHNHVHHVVYRNLLDVTLDDLKVLCEECHDHVHVTLKAHPNIEWNDIVKTFGVSRKLDLNRVSERLIEPKRNLSKSGWHKMSHGARVSRIKTYLDEDILFRP